MLSADMQLNEAALLSILESGHSRIPVHKPGNKYVICTGLSKRCFCAQDLQSQHSCVSAHQLKTPRTLSTAIFKTSDPITSPPTCSISLQPPSLSNTSPAALYTPRRKELIGIILVKELILVDKDASTRVGELKMRSAPQLRADTRLYDMLRLFETGRCHMAVLVQPPAPSTPRPSTGVCLLPALALLPDLAISRHSLCQGEDWKILLYPPLDSAA